MESSRTTHLGNTEIEVSTIGLGTMQWGYKSVIKEFSNNPSSNICDLYEKCTVLGINFFDTAEIYGKGKSETLLGSCVNTKRDNIVIASKFMPFPWRISKLDMRKALISSIKRLGVSRIDLYQIHWPFPPVPIKTWMETMAELMAEGLIRAIGVSNFSVSQTEYAYRILSTHGIPLASNQVRYSLLHRKPERNGLVDLCKKLNISIIAYSPLEEGILTGKYWKDRLPTDLRSWRYNRRYLAKIEPLLKELKQIGENNNEKTIGQVSLSWLVSKGAIPIPGAKDIYQAQENAGAIGWSLSDEEIAKLDAISDHFS